jgi:hypothetical protein
MPASIIVAITALSVMITLNIGLGLLALLFNPTAIFQVAISMGLGALVLLGMVFGHRLAWQWGRILGMFAAVLLTFAVVMSLFSTRPGVQPWVNLVASGILLIQAICLYMIFFALGRSSAREHFGLRCPTCGRFTNAAADFFFTRAKCKMCGNVW